MLKALMLIVAGLSVLGAASASAEVRVETVRFVSNGETIVGALYLPEEASADRPGPALVVSGAWMTIKEQMSSRYAREMAERGFVALAFDFRNWGESGGERRLFEDPAAKVEDLKAAAGFLAGRREVAPGRIGALAVCVSSSYLAQAAIEAPTIRAVAMVAPWLHDEAIVTETYGGVEGLARLRASADRANDAYSRTGEQTLVPVASTTDRTALLFQVPYYTEADRGMIAAWPNQADLGFWPSFLAFDAIALAPRLIKPFLMVHSEAAAIPQGARRFYGSLTGSRREVWLEGVTQFDFYDQDEPVNRAADEAASHFRDALR
jgi:fermentation-respiration switch protein FrsA (DUF1100 family)